MSTLSPAELQARIRLHCLPQLGPKRFERLLSAFGSAGAALSAPASAWQALGLPASCADSRRDDATRATVEHALAWLEQPQHHLLHLGSPDYPALLAQISDPPPLLFVAGEPALLERPQLAIVGSRNASSPGLDNARRFAHSLASGGFTITSGLALGIDGAAHQGALDAQGKTIAVLGTGLNRVYPQRHQRLAQMIVAQGGALVSELPLMCPAHASNFPRRNRIISGLALGVLVVEASPSSGSLITAKLAAEQGREIYAIPGSIHHPGARGCHQLIREGATLVESIDDILPPLQGWQRTTAQPPMHEPASGLWQQLLAGPSSSEALALHSQRPLPEILAELTELELEGKAVFEAGQWVGRRP